MGRQTPSLNILPPPGTSAVAALLSMMVLLPMWCLDRLWATRIYRKGGEKNEQAASVA